MTASRDDMARRLGIDPAGTALDATGRRSFMKLLGASIALAGLDGCTRVPASNILPYVNQPELTPGVPQYYATSMVIDGYATGLVVESHVGRPTKVEGNPDHPASLGAAGVYEQASLLQLYDPERARDIRHRSTTATWNDLAQVLAPAALRPRIGERGAGLFFLLEPTSSPLERLLLERVQELYPAAGVHFYAPLSPLADPVVPQYDLREADVIVAVDTDFLASGPFHLRYAREFAARRRPDAPRGMNRCYAIEPSVTVTGTMADHRLAVRPSELVLFLEALLAAVSSDRTLGTESTRGRWTSAVAEDLRAHAGRSVVVAGPFLPPDARALASRINDVLGNTGQTVWHTRSPLIGAGDPNASLVALVAALRAGEVDTLVIARGNPSYATAAVQELPSLIRGVRQSVYLGPYENETARDCEWMVPSAHFLESWGDARAYDGTLSIVQPLIEPIAGGRTTAELLALVLGQSNASTYELLRESWRSRYDGEAASFEDLWRSTLARGFVPDSAFPAEAPASAAPVPEKRNVQAAPIEVAFRPHSRVHDGTFGNNAWLQELPDPVTTLTWDNAAYVAPSTAQRMGLVTGDVVEIGAGDRTIRLPALLVPGHADDTVTIHFGYGRDGAESVARGVGVNVFPLWTGDGFSIGAAHISRVGGVRRDLAITQPHHTLATTDAARSISLDRYPHLAEKPWRGRELTLYQPPVSLPDGPAAQQWGMTIDLTACIGCGACMAACQAENNVPAVGREDVLRGREMHWLRIDWYGSNSPEEPPRISQPMLCQHCEFAPCEYVCPVEATVHSRDGLNEMIYNRCVGTRFCSNNCPYKVRRFNWFDYNADLTPVEQLVKNPDVTVRERGVMEKCTFCVQRIRQAEIAARVDGQPIATIEVQTACQQTCPTQAIVFGSLTDRNSQLVRERNSPRAYAVLEHLGTVPRVLYLSRVRNPNPVLG